MRLKKRVRGGVVGRGGGGALLSECVVGPRGGELLGSHRRNGWNSHQEGTSPKAWASSGARVSLPWASRGFSLPLSS